MDRFPECGAVVSVEYGGDNPHNDLVSCMEYILVNKNNNNISYDVILTPSDVIGFQLLRLPSASSSSKSSPDPLVYPKTLHLDRFLFHNLGVTNEKRRIEQKMQQEIQELKRQRNTLTLFNVRFFVSSYLPFFLISIRGEIPSQICVLPSIIMNMSLKRGTSHVSLLWKGRSINSRISSP